MTPWLSIDEWSAKALAGSVPDDAVIRATFSSEVKEAAEGNRRLRFVISTGHPDRDKDVVNPAGVRLDAYKRNPVVPWCHSYHDLPIAKCTEIGAQGNRLVATAEFATAEDYPFADTVYRLLRKGFLSGTSIGFRPITFALNADRGGYDFHETELLEWSVVVVPANSEALLLAASASGDRVDVEPIKAWLSAYERKQRSEDIVFRLVDDGPSERYRIMDNRLTLAHDSDPTLAIDMDDMREVLQDIFARELFAPLLKVATQTVARTIAEAQGKVY